MVGFATRCKTWCSAPNLDSESKFIPKKISKENVEHFEWNLDFSMDLVNNMILWNSVGKYFF